MIVLMHLEQCLVSSQKVLTVTCNILLLQLPWKFTFSSVVSSREDYRQWEETFVRSEVSPFSFKK